MKFSKYGPIRFVGHLDVMRYFQKVMRRADVPVAYSEGYSPHQLMSFAQPLSVGATSDGEYMDLVLTDDLPETQEGQTTGEDVRRAYARRLTERLNAVCHEGIRILHAQVLPEKAEKAMTAVAACAWKAALREDEALLPQNPAERTGRLSAFLSRETIPVHKKTGKGLTETDIKPMIYRAAFTEDGYFDLLLKSGSEDNVKPALFLGAFLRFLSGAEEALYLQGDELKPEALILHRVETYMEREDETGRFLVPLTGDGEERFKIALSR